MGAVRALPNISLICTVKYSGVPWVTTYKYNNATQVYTRTQVKGQGRAGQG